MPIADQLGKPAGDLAHRQDEIREARRDGAAGHRSILGLVRILNQNDAPGLLDRLDADGPVRTGARKNDGEVVAPLRRERAEEEIDRRALPARLVELGDRQMLVGRQKLPVGRNDIDVARFEGHAAGDLRHRHSRSGRENAGKLALVPGIEMHDDNESRVDIVRQTFEKHLQGVNAPGGRSDADRRKSLVGFNALGHVVHLRPQTLRSTP